MLEELDVLWLYAIEPQIDGKVIAYLSACHPGYKKLLRRQDELIMEYPVIVSIEVKDKAISLNREEYQMLREYMDNQIEMEELEKSYSVYYAQDAVFSHRELLRKLYREMNREEDRPDYEDHPQDTLTE